MPDAHPRNCTKTLYAYTCCLITAQTSTAIWRIKLYQPTHDGTTRRGRPQLNYVDYIERLSGMRTDELVEVLQVLEAWHELVVACNDPQPPD